MSGWVNADGAFNKGVLMIGEAAGETEELNGIGFVGKSGYYLWGNLRRIGLERDDFRVANVLSCRPPNNKLVDQPYEKDAIDHCRSNLDAVIAECREEAIKKGLTFTILTLGKTAFKRVLGLDDKIHERLLKLDYICYPFWSEEYQAWVIAAHHPSYLQRGNHHLLPLLQFAAQRAVEIATNGFSYEDTKYIEDPTPEAFKAWVDDYFKVANDDTFLSYDIETPMKVKQGNEEKVSKEDDNDYTILRCSFAYRPREAVSVVWGTEHRQQLERIFGGDLPKLGWNNNNYDDPRILAQVPIIGDRLDGMLAWHVLNSALPKALGFVAPFYARRTGMWKHLAEAKPAFYNAKDADMALQCWLGIRDDLKKNNLWDLFLNHVIRMNRVFNYMSQQGVMRDERLRTDVENRLTAVMEDIDTKIQTVVPIEAKAAKMRVGNYCPNCLARDVRAAHFKSVGKKRLKAGETENPCHGFKAVKEKVVAAILPFKLSNKALQRYQTVKKHRAILTPKDRKVTFDDKAILRLRKKYPNDPLYPLIGEYRSHQKLRGTYVGVTQPNGTIKGGLKIDEENIIHCTFTRNPSTLRSACQNPNLQNLPRPGGPDDPATWIRNLVVARPGRTFLARDYSGIEAVLTGYFAGDPGYVRLAKHDVHSFYTAYALHELDGRISANDLPHLDWDDSRLFARLADIKKEFKEERNSLYKHLVHGANFMQGAKGAAEKILAETGKEYPVSLVSRVMDIYFELFPSIREWHKATLEQADHDGYLRNPFGYVHRFLRIYEWDLIGDLWQKEPGPDANKAIAFKPQSTAMGIISEANMRLYYDRFEEAGQYLRLLIHDETFTEVPDELVDAVDAVLVEEMEKPILCLPLPAAWNMGSHLVINTEAKLGNRWGQMR